jgi:hypothetical protein
MYEVRKLDSLIIFVFISLYLNVVVKFSDLHFISRVCHRRKFTWVYVLSVYESFNIILDVQKIHLFPSALFKRFIFILLLMQLWASSNCNFSVSHWECNWTCSICIIKYSITSCRGLCLNYLRKIPQMYGSMQCR